MLSRGLRLPSEARFCGAFPLRRLHLASQKPVADNHLQGREVRMLQPLVETFCGAVARAARIGVVSTLGRINLIYCRIYRGLWNGGVCVKKENLQEQDYGADEILFPCVFHSFSTPRAEAARVHRVPNQTCRLRHAASVSTGAGQDTRSPLDPFIHSHPVTRAVPLLQHPQEFVLPTIRISN